jgi:hypothetical protein
MIHRNQVFLGSALFRRKVLKAGGLFDPELFGGEDYELCLRYASTHRFGFFARPLAQYEKHSGGLSSSVDRMAREFALAVLKFTASPSITPSERRKALRNGGFAPKSAAFWFACCLPGPILRTFRRIWQGLHR